MNIQAYRPIRIVSILAAVLFACNNSLAQRAAPGEGSVEETTIEIFDDFGGGFFEVPVLKISGTAKDDACFISNDGPTGLQVRLNGVNYPVDPTEYYYEVTFNGMEGDDRFVFRAEDFPSWTFWVRGGDGDDFMLNATANIFSMAGDAGDDTLMISYADRKDLGKIGLQYGSDFIRQNLFVPILSGGPGNDIFNGGVGGVRMYGGDGDDIFNCGLGDDEAYGGNGDDIILCGPGNDRAYGGPGMDMINGGLGNDWLDLGRYDLYQQYETQRLVTDDRPGIVVAGPGDDYIVTGPFVDDVRTGHGTNLVVSPVVPDNLSGKRVSETVAAKLPAPFGSGLVQFYESSVGGGVTMRDLSIVGTPFKDTCIVDDLGVLLNGVRYDVAAEDFLEFRGFDGDDKFVFRSTQRVWFGHAEGGKGDDFMSVRNFDISLDGGEGNDTLHDLYGTATIGGPGDDTFRLAGAKRRTRAHGGDGDDLFYGSDNGNTIFGDAGDDIIFGGAADDTIYGGIGADFISAEGGNDTIDSGIRAGHTEDTPDSGDFVNGGPGNDIIKTGYGDDEIQGGDGDDEIEAGPDNDSVVAGSGNDTILLGDGDDYASGGVGDDTIMGERGDDIIFGNSGNNTLDGGPGNNIVR